MQLPAPLRAALEAEAARFKLSELSRAHERLSERYRAGAPPSHMSNVERAAYALTRMPATQAACSAVLAEVSKQLAHADTPIGITSLLDLGAGLGSMLWAASEALPALRTAILIESDAGMIDLGKRMAQGLGGHAPADWIKGDLRRQSLPEQDLVTFSYSLGELPEADAVAVLAKAWQAARKLLIVIEPGTPVGFRRVRKWREQLLSQGAHMAAPCPHALACPMSSENGGTDWCHFAQRVERTSLHRRLKGGELGHEDEKVSYIAVSKSPLQLPAARIVRHPQVAPGEIKLELCTEAGLQSLTATKRDREQFRQARHARWGDAWEPAPKQSLRSAGE
jgi:ribosomal protein RSM22 (predicted rRNA methylase)